MRTARLPRRGAALAAGLEIALIFALVVLAAAAPGGAGPGEPSTPPILDAQGQPVRSAIASLEPVAIGGVKQWLLLRGHDIWSPVLLYLDRAPGTSQMAWSRRYNAALEKQFIVVNWDQRGAGKSFTGKAPSSQSPIEQAVSDLLELTGQLRTRFRQEKIYLLGHGVGATIGAVAAERHPELFHALIAVGPVVNPAEADLASYQYATEAATLGGDTAALGELKALGPPPYAGKELSSNYAALREVTLRFAGAKYPSNEFRQTMAAAVAEAPEYSPAERQRLPEAEAQAFAAMYPALARLDLAREVPALAIPAYFVLGRHDHAAAPLAAEKYFEALKAPAKSLAWFEQSGPAPNYEEPDKFLQLMVSGVLTDTLQRREVTQ